MANPKHLAILDQGVEAWNKWREENPGIEPDLSGANLIGRNLTLFDMSAKEMNREIARILSEQNKFNDLVLFDINYEQRKIAKAKGCNLSKADLTKTNLSKASLIGANLSDAKFFYTNLAGSALQWADLRDAYFEASRLSRVNLSNASLSGSVLIEVNFNNATLKNANLCDTYFFEAKLRKSTLINAELSSASFHSSDLSYALLDGSDLTYTTFTRTNLEGTSIKGCRIYGISVWDVNSNGSIQSDLIISDNFEPILTVESIEVAQFIYLLLNNQGIRSIIDTITSKVILILGRFTLERKPVLDAIKEEIRKRDYVPVMFDFEKPVSRDFTETIKTLAHLAKFIIADLTDARCVPQELQTIVPTLKVPLKPLVLQGSNDPWTMFKDLALYPWVLKTTRYRDISDLSANFQEKIIQPAEQKAQELIIEKGRPLLYS